MREEIGNKRDIGVTVACIASIYQKKNELDTALEYFERSLVILEKADVKADIAYVLYRLIIVSLDLEEIIKAKDYLIGLQLINEQEENKIVDLYSRLSKALILKNSSRRNNLTKAEEILEEIVEEDIIIHELTVRALFNLSELLLDELRHTSKEEILEELEEKVGKLMKIAEEQESYTLLAETFWLSAQLALIRLDLKKARNLLVHAQIIAEKKGLERLARKISSEHDQLLGQLAQWEELIANDASITERVKVASLDELIGWMARRREIKIDKKEEKPVMLLLVSEGGLPIYCNKFDQRKELPDMLISAFLTIVNNFVREAFEVKGMIRRITHDEYILSFNLIESILFCYVYDGQSYTAMKKLEKLVSVVHESEVWSALKEVGKTGNELNEKEKEQMEGMIGEIFITN
jgi:tetratricopeptide (TPR) repeat protein